MILYLIIIIILIITLFYIYIKVKHKFWSIQPVFHYYNIYYWIRKVGIINEEEPIYNKYLNIININTYDVNILSNTDTQLIINFIKNNYLNTKYIKYLPEKSNIFSYLSNNNHKSYISIYKKPKLLINNENISDVVEYSEYIGLITSKVLYIKFNDNNNNNNNNNNNICNKDYYEDSNKGYNDYFNDNNNHNNILPVYYVDNLCVNKNNRNQGIAPQLIQTHYYHIRKNNKQIKCCLFKKEGNLTPIVPLLAYDTYVFDTDSIINNEILNSINYLNSRIYKIIKITSQTFHLLTSFIQLNKLEFDCIIMPDYSNLLNLINTNNIFIYVLISFNVIKAIYCYRNSCVNYDTYKSIELFSSIKSDIITDDDFYNGYIKSLYEIKSMIKNKYILIENLSKNNIIINKFKKKLFIIIKKNPTGFFLYNYVKTPFEPCKVFILY